jgi:hypothetical protein
MTDSMVLMREMKKMNEKLAGMSQLITSTLDLQGKMLNCESSINSPQLNSDFVVGNLNDQELNNVGLDLEIGRFCFAIGASDAGMSYFHSASEKVNLSRSKYGFMPKVVRTTISQSTASVKEESAGMLKLGRNKEGM